MPSTASAAGKDNGRLGMSRSEPTRTPIPSLEECVRLMEQYAMLANIRHHSLVVARLAGQLIEGLGVVSPDLPHPDRWLVIAGALLHDIAKTPCLNTDGDHAKAGGDICRRHGFAEIAVIVEEHVLLRHYDPERYRTGAFSAAELVYYADKRVRHNVVVNLDERLEYIIDHYGRGNPVRRQLIRENFHKCLDLEQHLFCWLPFRPEDLGGF
jgi:putative nucleotidyltransferase with HDIG domain